MAHRFLTNLCNPWSSSCFTFGSFTSPHGTTSHNIAWDLTFWQICATPGLAAALFWTLYQSTRHNMAWDLNLLAQTQTYSWPVTFHIFIKVNVTIPNYVCGYKGKPARDKNKIYSKLVSGSMCGRGNACVSAWWHRTVTWLTNIMQAKQKELLYCHAGNPRVEATTSLYVPAVNVALAVTLQLQFTLF